MLSLKIRKKQSVQQSLKDRSYTSVPLSYYISIYSGSAAIKVIKWVKLSLPWKTTWKKGLEKKCLDGMA